ncbi:transcription factor EMB1444-like [Durio zibethinus]|uniref:Transcription factor EMB1444-like n=1 Tax=Durio zibethinus TaxID=66656 RepID=A0A6P6AXE4_DURZI|nr:transcription factor EMB1444-like [Durio zibethinus]
MGLNSFNAALQAEKYGVDHSCYSNFLHTTLRDTVKSDGLSSYRNKVLEIPKFSDMKFQKDMKKLGNQNDLSDLDSINTSLKFSAGCELYEALGPAFLRKGIYADRLAENTEAGANIEMVEGMRSSQLNFEYGSENLLEAVVANVCNSGSDIKSERSFCRSAASLLTTGNTPEPSSQTKLTINSAGYSINESSLAEDNTQQCLNSSELCGAMPSKGFSSACPSNCSEQHERSLEPAKTNRKRARPGENPRPRPRDRQLIQDRIKELRDLVPNGAKCSIDSLLERTIKHMVFLQGITKHADKLGKCSEPKELNDMHHKGAGMLGSSNYEHGSSWAVEVGSHLKVCSIVVENINKNGQMLVELLFAKFMISLFMISLADSPLSICSIREFVHYFTGIIIQKDMMCKECSHFLEIAEAIGSLGLTILKGVTEAHGEETWICFVVEKSRGHVQHLVLNHFVFAFVAVICVFHWLFACTKHADGMLMKHVNDFLLIWAEQQSYA